MIESRLLQSTTSSPSAPARASRGPLKSFLLALSILAAAACPSLIGDPWVQQGTDHIEGTLAVTPVVSRVMDGPLFRVELSSRASEEIEAPLLTTRIGLVLDGAELEPRVYRWAGMVTMIQPGESYGLVFGLGTFLPGTRRASYSQQLGRWRWEVPLPAGRHRVRFFLRKDRALDSERLYSNEIELIWDDSQPLLYSDAPGER